MPQRASTRSLPWGTLEALLLRDVWSLLFGLVCALALAVVDVFGVWVQA